MLRREEKEREKDISLREQTLRVHQENWATKQSLCQQNEGEIKSLGKRIRNLEKSVRSRLGSNLPSTRRLFESLRKEDANVDEAEDKKQRLGKKRDKMRLEGIQLKQQLGLLSGDIQDLKNRLLEWESRKTQLEQDAKDKRDELGRLEQDMETFRKNRQSALELEEREQKLEKKIRELEGVENTQGKLKMAEKDIRREAKSFRGELAGLISLLDSKYRLACGLALGAKLGYFVMDRQEEFGVVDRLLKEYYLNKNVIVLENYPQQKNKKLYNDMRINVIDSGYLAYDLLELRDKSDVLLDEYLRGVLAHVYVTTDLQTAFRLKQKLGDKFKKIITLNGKVVKPRSVESVGHADYTPLYVKKLQDFNVIRERARLEIEAQKLREQRAELEGEGPRKDLARVQSQLQALEKESEQVLVEKEKVALNLSIKEEERRLIQNKSDYLEKELGHCADQLGRASNLRAGGLRTGEQSRRKEAPGARIHQQEPPGQEDLRRAADGRLLGVQGHIPGNHQTQEQDSGPGRSQFGPGSRFRQVSH